jgi:hypothetical protein
MCFREELNTMSISIHKSFELNYKQIIKCNNIEPFTFFKFNNVIWKLPTAASQNLGFMQKK